MKILQEINKENIRRKVMSEISKAKKEILATMNIAEDLVMPLPPAYFSLLGKKFKEKVKIRRVVFGTKKQYGLFLKKIKIDNLFFTGKHTNSKNYKRMILIDGTKLFFRKKTKGKEKFYFTINGKYIKEYKAYFNKFKY